ncbi:hypothetical protein Tco_0966302 [Tanacetum coccineum]
MVYFVDGVLASGVEIILEMDFVRFVLQELEIHSFMIQIRTLSMISKRFQPPSTDPSMRPTRYFQWMSYRDIKKKELQHLEQAAKVSSQYWKPPIFYDNDDDDDEESSIPLRDIISELPLSVAITPDLPITDSLIMGNEELSTIPKKESDEFIKPSVKDLVPVLSESKDTSESDSDCDLPSCDDFFPINGSEEKSMTFSNPLFDSNDDFTSSDDESLSDEGVLEDNL